MIRHLFIYTLVFIGFSPAFSQKKKAQADYFPEAGNWQHRSPVQMGLDSGAISKAIIFARDQEVKASRDMEVAQAQSFGKAEPFSEGIGPFATRGEPTGIIVYKGYIVAQWGEPNRVDMTHSVTKSFLSTLVGLAVERGLIHSVYDTVAAYVPPIQVYDPEKKRSTEDIGKPEMLYPFTSAHNRQLTWDVMLRQTSDWEGTLWGKPDWADRPEGDASKWLTRLRNTPGTVWKYNDVRVNALSLAALNVWRKPLPQVLKDYIMDPIGASNTWRWYGYRNSWIVLDGQPVQSVAGGGHWGGGLFINAYDMARFGLLTMHRGNWNGKQLISEQWVKQALTPTSANPEYGYMNWFLNTGRKLMPSAPETAFVHIGNGINIIYVDPEHQLVMVVRWIDNKAIDGMVQHLLESLKNK